MSPDEGKRGGDGLPILAALRHPLRRRILKNMLAGGPTSPRLLADTLEEPLGNVSYHVKVLEKNDAVKLVGTRQVRGSVQHFYAPEPMEPWAIALLAHSEGDRQGRSGSEPVEPPGTSEEGAGDGDA